MWFEARVYRFCILWINVIYLRTVQIENVCRLELDCMPTFVSFVKPRP